MFCHSLTTCSLYIFVLYTGCPKKVRRHFVPRTNCPNGVFRETNCPIRQNVPLSPRRQNVPNYAMMHRKVAGKLLGHFVSCPTLSIWRPIPWAKVAHLGDMYWTYLGYILTTFWLLSGYTSCYTWATFRLHSGYILATFWLHYTTFYKYLNFEPIIRGLKSDIS